MLFKPTVYNVMIKTMKDWQVCSIFTRHEMHNCKWSFKRNKLPLTMLIPVKFLFVKEPWNSSNKIPNSIPRIAVSALTVVSLNMWNAVLVLLTLICVCHGHSIFPIAALQGVHVYVRILTHDSYINVLWCRCYSPHR